jgi:probable F420-dependent oxidoreductase
VHLERNRQVRIGLQIPQAGPNASADFVTQYVRQAQRLGINTFWVGDHILMGGFKHRAKVDENFLEPLVLLGFVAGFNSAAELGTSVLVVPYRNLFVLAKGLATVAHLIRGRLKVGIGAGWAEEEFTALGRDFHQRGKAADQFCEIFHRLRTQPDEPWSVGPYTYQGGGFAPSLPARAELWVGGNSPAARRRAARWGDAWQPTGLAPDAVHAGMDDVRALCEATGRDPDTVTSGIRIRVRLRTPEQRKGLETTLSAYIEAGVTDLLLELNTREQSYALQAIEEVGGTCKAMGIL